MAHSGWIPGCVQNSLAEMHPGGTQIIFLNYLKEQWCYTWDPWKYFKLIAPSLKRWSNRKQGQDQSQAKMLPHLSHCFQQRHEKTGKNVGQYQKEVEFLVGSKISLCWADLFLLFWLFGVNQQGLFFTCCDTDVVYLVLLFNTNPFWRFPWQVQNSNWRDLDLTLLYQ